MAYQLHTPSKTVNPNLNSQEPILFLHGVFGSKDNYRNYCKTIANNTLSPVYAIDFRNHGESEHCFPLADYKTLVQDVVDFCEDHGLKKVKLVGFSLGAKVSLLMMLKHPELVSSGVIIDNAPAKTPGAGAILASVLKGMKTLFKSADIKAHDKAWRSKAGMVLSKYIPDGGIVQYLLRNITNKNSSHIPGHEDLITWKIPMQHFDSKTVEAIVDWPEEEVKGDKFYGPVKVVRGLRSFFIFEEELKAYRDQFPNHTMTELNTGHLIFTEMPQRATRIISEFFKQMKYKELQEQQVDNQHEAHLLHADVKLPSNKGNGLGVQA
jgi:pimeloyl-ACP methyl ester carboxylesterase